MSLRNITYTDKSLLCLCTKLYLDLIYGILHTGMESIYQERQICFKNKKERTFQD